MTDPTNKSRRRPPTYTPQPELPGEVSERYETVVAALDGALTISEAARRLGLSRNHFQTILHRGQSALIEAISPGLPGRPRRPQTEIALQEQNEHLQRENDRLREDLATTQRLMSIASELITSRTQRRRPRSTSSSSRSTSSKPSPAKKADEDPGDARMARLPEAGALSRALRNQRMAARAMGVDRSTMRRWERRARAGQPLVRRRGPKSSPALTATSRSRVEHEVRATRGIVGAAALAKRMGVSRRQAQAIKRQTLTQIERERQRSTTRTRVTMPGLVRGFDQLWVRSAEGDMLPALVSADAAVPYRTTIMLAERYDDEAVADALERDFLVHGAPLVLRLDRARQHRTLRVNEVLARFGVLALHGPPRHPQYYGQMERQNREHRAWQRAGDVVPRDVLPAELARMCTVLNERVPRRSFGGRTACEVWSARSAPDLDRATFAKEVEERVERRLAERGDDAPNLDRLRRFAIEATLQAHGYLRRRGGAGCSVISTQPSAY